MSEIAQIETSREQAQVRPTRVFDHLVLSKYSCGRRALFRSVSRKYPDLSGTMLSWVLVYLLTLSVEQAIAQFADPAIALVEAVKFAEAYNSKEQEEEALNVAEAIFQQIDAAVVRPDSTGEADPKA